MLVSTRINTNLLMQIKRRRHARRMRKRWKITPLGFEGHACDKAKTSQRTLNDSCAAFQTSATQSEMARSRKGHGPAIRIAEYNRNAMFNPCCNIRQRRNANQIPVYCFHRGLWFRMMFSLFHFQFSGGVGWRSQSFHARNSKWNRYAHRTKPHGCCVVWREYVFQLVFLAWKL